MDRNKPLRIAMISNLCPPDFDGGYEMRALQVASSLRERGHDVQLVTSAYRDSFTGERSDPPWVHRILRYVEKGEAGIAKLTRFLAVMPASVENAATVRAWMKDREFDIAYPFGLHRIGLACHVPFVEAGVPVLWHCGDVFLVKQLRTWPKKAPPYAWLLKTKFKAARALEARGDYDNIAFLSDHLRNLYRQAGMEPERSFIIPRAVDFEARIGEREREEPPLFFMACRIHEQKGVHVAVMAAQLLSARCPNLDWRLEIAGREEHPAYREELEGLIKKWGLSGRVEFLGQLSRDKVLDKIAVATAVIHAPIFEEPFGNALVEAPGLGTPLIGSDIGAIREVLEPEKSVLLFTPGDPAAL